MYMYINIYICIYMGWVFIFMLLFFLMPFMFRLPHSPPHLSCRSVPYAMVSAVMKMVVFVVLLGPIPKSRLASPYAYLAFPYAHDSRSGIHSLVDA